MNEPKQEQKGGFGLAPCKPEGEAAFVTVDGVEWVCDSYGMPIMAREAYLQLPKGGSKMEKTIAKFDGDYRWLSNFWPVAILFEGRCFPSVEHAYQAAKVPAELRGPFCLCSAGQAKRLGQRPKLPLGWEEAKLLVMAQLLAVKFAEGTPLAKKLLATEEALLVEGNHWGDRFWGVCGGVGENKLGLLLMQHRRYLSALQSPTNPR